MNASHPDRPVSPARRDGLPQAAPSVLSSTHRRGPVVLAIMDISFAFPFGLAYIAGYLRERGEDVRILFWPHDPARQSAFLDEIAALEPVLVGFSGLFPDLYVVRGFVEGLNARGRKFPIVVGGQMVSPTPRMALDVTGADFGCLEEGEITTFHLVQALRQGDDPVAVPGLAVRDGSDVTLTGPGEYIHDLSQLPRIPYDLFPARKWLRIGRFYTRHYQQPHWHFDDRIISIHGGRGCPYRCNFCYHHSRARYRDIHDMMEETARLLVEYDANMVYFGDDLVIATPKRVAELLDGIPRLPRKVEFSVSCRFNILEKLDDGALEALAACGCRIMGLGIESGSDRILKVMNKRITTDMVRRGMTRLKRAGILPTVSIMVGQVSETVLDVALSERLMVETTRENPNTQYAFTIATPFPGSPMFDDCVARGLIADEYDFFRRFDPLRQHCALTVNASDMTDAEVVESHARLCRVFADEKRRGEGPLVQAVERTRGALAAFDERRRIRYAPDGVQRVPFGLPPRLYDNAYERLQGGLDRLRLHLRGL